MANLRHDFRGRAPQKYGKTTVTFPYGDTRFVRIVAQRAARKGTREALQIPFLTPFPDQASYPGALLISQVSDGGDDTDKNITETYETLPGPIFVDIRAYRETGIPMLTSRQRVAANAMYLTGEFQPTAVNVSSIADNGDGTATVETATPHELPQKAWVVFASTNSTPAIDGNRQIISVPSETEVVIAISLSDAGTAAGTMQGINRITRELQPVPNNASVLVKIDTMVAVASTTDIATRTVESVVDAGSGTATVTVDAAHGLSVGDWVMLSGTNSIPPADGPRKILSIPLTTKIVIEFAVTTSGTAAGTAVPMGPLAGYNEDFHCWKNFDFPDFLKAANFYSSSADTSGYNAYNFALSWGGALAPQLQDGYRGPCRARRLRCFFVGPPPSSFEENLSPTFIMPSSGTFIVQGGSKSKIFTPDLANFTEKDSTDYRTGRIPHCLTGPSPAVTTIVPGDATAILNLIESVPTHFTQGDIIALMGQPTKYDAGALWEVVVFLVEAPYTSGSAPA